MTAGFFWGCQAVAELDTDTRAAIDGWKVASGLPFRPLTHTASTPLPVAWIAFVAASGAAQVVLSSILAA